MPIDNLIIDGTNIEFRTFYVTRNTKTVNSTGEQTSCIFKFLQTFNRLINKFDPTHIYASWDKKLTRQSTNFRKEMLNGQYKASRVMSPDIQEMFDQEINLIEILESLGTKNIYPNTLEADDVCSWLANTLPGSSVIISADQDLLQLISPQISVYNLKELITYDNFKEKKGISPEAFLLFKAIKGDPSDNIKGLDGYGEVKSARLASNWDPSLITEEQHELVKRNLILMDLKHGYNAQDGEKLSYEAQFNYTKDIKADLNKFRSLCEKYEFHTYLNNMGDWKKNVNRNNIVELINNL